MSEPLFAAIDCGTNSTRLMIGDGRTTSERLMRITRLGRGVDAAGRLSTEAIEATVNVLAEFREVMAGYDIEATRLTATSAVRDAANRSAFIGPASDIIGVTPEVLSGREEAALSFVGAISDLDPIDGSTLVVDIGGGSTEVAVGDRSPLSMTSIDVGCVRVTERYLSSDPPGPDELASALSVLDLYWDDVVAEVPAVAEVDRVVGLAGTVATVAAVELGLASYDRDRIHHFVLSKEAAEDVFRTLATESLADRIHNPGLEVERADVIVGGCLVLVSMMRRFSIDEMIVSECDILDGLVQSLRFDRT